MNNKSTNGHPSPTFVGTITTKRGLAQLAKKSRDADLIEVRVDALLEQGVDPEKILDRLQKRKTPALLTLRSKEEGGRYEWDRGERAALLTAMLPDADAVDIELASVKELSSIMALARKLRLQLILSAHSMDKPVTLATLNKWVMAFQTAKPTIAKISTFLSSPDDLKALARILLAPGGQPWALMGLGPLAGISRVVLATLGSKLVYGYLDQPVSPGHPSIKKLKSSFLLP